MADDPKQLPLIRRRIRGKRTPAQILHDQVVEQRIREIAAKKEGGVYRGPKVEAPNIPKGGHVVAPEQVTESQSFAALAKHLLEMQKKRKDEEDD